MDWIITRHFSRRPSAVLSISSGMLGDTPGIILMSFLKVPMPFMASNWSYMSVSVNLPLRMALALFFGTLISASRTLSRSVSRSPMPRSLPANLEGMKGSMSSTFSPVPMNLIGAPVAATAESAPPPRAEPSSFVTKIEPMGVASLKAFAWARACWPIVPSMMSMTSSGLMLFSSVFISLMSSCSSLWRPEVSTMIMSLSGNCLSPSLTTLTGSLALGSPYMGTFILLASCWSCAYAPGRKVSAQIRAGFIPLFWKYRASLAPFVVFPEPCMPTSMIVFRFPGSNFIGTGFSPRKRVSSS